MKDAGVVQYINAMELTVGDLIVTRFDKKTGIALSGYEVKKIERRRGCQHVHVNDNQCFDRVGQVPVTRHASALTLASIASILEVATVEYE